MGSLPHVVVQLRSFSAQVHSLLQSHDGSLPLARRVANWNVACETFQSSSTFLLALLYGAYFTGCMHIGCQTNTVKGLSLNVDYLLHVKVCFRVKILILLPVSANSVFIVFRSALPPSFHLSVQWLKAVYRWSTSSPVSQVFRSQHQKAAVGKFSGQKREELVLVNNCSYLIAVK